MASYAKVANSDIFRSPLQQLPDDDGSISRMDPQPERTEWALENAITGLRAAGLPE